MRVLIVYESMFGNTARIADAVADGMSGRVSVRTAEVGTNPGLSGVDALVVGGPTHAFGLSRPATRRDAQNRGAPPGPVGTGLREWLAALGHAGVPATAFDTKIGKPFLPGSAARTAAKALRHAGCPLVAPAQSFLVEDTAGPLRDGELDRARRWGAEVAALLATWQPAR
ncbi:flavodoxin family protein [Spirilliplanes yamanashiensis]|uniref:Flavodoxin n=1 Tax=Spirilliplanes yamanashiensis TaxID=42233 RepID=A0A8J4DN14_9ACTN|nr:flavodoxin [Spirilliplanes yamanashiensis]MDP9818208.1 hypothetical protein [Spirilliplanes yamanashiensis]GIJ06765.1 flavodoxin [Spirilliplanes yamanashiensis]